MAKAASVLAAVLAFLLAVVGCAPGKPDRQAAEQTVAVERREPVDITELVLAIPGPEPVPLRMLRIPAGSFVMGSPEGTGHADEQPGQRVTISQPFWLGVYPVTQAQWQAVMGTNPSHFTGDPERPVDSVTWTDCQEFVGKLSSLGIGTFRLPTEAEWEYACRADTVSRYFWGDEPERMGDYVWYRENAGEETHPVGEKKPNPWGLYDMNGNVLERCEDWYGPYTAGDKTDPKGPAKGADCVMRGGSWNCGPAYCRPAARGWCSPFCRYNFYGFRLVRLGE
ncbi:MAG: formylglycine-generating enzyme family protein [Lentisphaeria bacterium]|jgi:formylglycine-generating enzyme required for sulfatase activity|nr:formylglycine-generating enzyme family protein [Lentisphaeria bacterium]